MTAHVSSKVIVSARTAILPLRVMSDFPLSRASRLKADVEDDDVEAGAVAAGATPGARGR